MLVLSRKETEKIVINGDIIIEIVKIQGNRVKLGIEAPASVAILRSELGTVDAEPKPTLQDKIGHLEWQLASAEATIETLKKLIERQGK